MTKAVMGFPSHKLEPGSLIDAPRRNEDAIGPEHEFFVAMAPRKADALFDEAGAQAQTTCLGSDQTQSEFSHCLTGLHDKHGADDFTSHLGNPAAFSHRLVVVDEIRDDLGHERFKAFVPAVLLSVQDAVSVRDPAHIPRLMRAQEERLGKLETFPFIKKAFDSLHRRQQTLLLLLAEVMQRLRHLVAGAFVEESKSLLASRGET